MTQTYRAILKNNQITWLGDRPNLSEAEEVDIVVVRSLAAPSKAEQQQKVATLLAQLAAVRPFEDIPDPVTWQREQRRDRALPFREN
ncbi:hypothetical protein [Leptolyngbya sp. KIOST-1]|uniref:hypothetical protein n=1 Tax=Leptolyngbya sp. KIOST-1 TaxID=1229172 RepID=UPI00056BAE51|nr:hypothetical protein [Leptolyngbya sp. KIOST-1]